MRVFDVCSGMSTKERELNKAISGKMIAYKNVNGLL